MSAPRFHAEPLREAQERLPGSMPAGALSGELLPPVDHPGDSDPTGTVCGNIADAVYGMRGLLPEWPGRLELYNVIDVLGRSALAEFSPHPPRDTAWPRRYPAW